MQAGPGVRGLMIMALLAGPALAEDWQPVTGPELKNLLDQKDIRFDNGDEQLFFLGGITRFSHGWPNEGRWRTKDGQYCSMWPPREEWVCMAVSVAGDGVHVKFEDSAHRVWLGEIVGLAKWP